MRTFHCEMEITLDVIGGKWKGLVMYYVIQKPRRTGELKRLVHNISQKMLVQTLRELENDGLIHRKMYNQIPPKVEYSATPLGQSLEPILKLMCNWGTDYANQSYDPDEIEILHLN